MNRKIIYSDSLESFSKLVGLGYEFIKYDEWTPESDTLYLVIGWEAFNKVQETVHLGLRNTNWAKCIELERVGISDNISFIFTYDSDEWYINRALENFNNPDITKPYIPEPPECNYITDCDKAIEVLNHLDSVQGYFGYDYESNGLPDQEDFLLTGLGISTTSEIHWFDFRFMNELDRFLNDGLRVFLDKNAERCVVFSVQFEFMATYRYLHKFYRFLDLNIINIVNSRGPWNNLKWTARLLCNINSWDDEFDSLKDDIEYYINEDGSVNTEELIKYFKDEKGFSDEDINEILTHLNVHPNGFYSIPMRILGKYCGLDCYYTVWSFINGKDKLLIENLKTFIPDYVVFNDYSGSSADIINRVLEMYPDNEELRDKIEYLKNRNELCMDVYHAGKVLEARINNQGMIKDSKFFESAVKTGEELLLQTGTTLVRFYYEFCKHWVGDNYQDLSKYNEITKKFIKEGVDISSGGYYLSRYLFGTRYYSENHEWYLDQNKVYEDFGDEIGQKLIDMLWECVDTNYNITRKRSAHTYIGEYLDTLVSIPEGIDEETHTKTVEYYQYVRYLEDLNNLPQVGTNIIDKDEFLINGEIYNRCENLNYVLGYINVNSPKNKEWLWDYWLETYLEVFMFLYIKCYELDAPLQGKYPSDILKDNNSPLNYEEVFEDDFNYFCENFDLLDDEAKNYCRNIQENPAMLTWPLERQLFLRWLNDYHYPGIKEYYIESVYTGRITGKKIDAILFGLNYRLFNKYYKSVNTYLKGTFLANDSNYEELDENWISDFKHHEWDPKMPTKSWADYTANKQYSLRWSSGYHTMPSLSEVKKCMSTTDDSLLAYFDISSAEVRTAAYLSKDPAMLDDFESGKDVYINTARVAFPDESDGGLYEVRGSFKTVLLGLLYGRGGQSIANEIGVDIEEAYRLINAVRERSKVLYEFIDYKSNFPSNHEWKLDTFLGEQIYTDSYNGVDRRHGINTIIQSFTAVMLVYGFENLLRTCSNYGIRLAPCAIVHDSITNLFSVDSLWKLDGFYRKEFTQFIYDKIGVRYLFDIKLGPNYFDVAKLSQIDDNTIELKGNADTLNGILDKLDKSGIKYEAISDDLNENNRFNRITEDIVYEFISYESREPIYDKDTSSYKIKLIKL